MATINPIPPVLSHQDLVRFWYKIECTATCWLWRGSIKDNGYADFYLRRAGIKRHVSAHRLAYFLATGVWPTLSVLHHCDVRACARFDHLFLGTQADNIADMVAKGRSLTGARNPMWGHDDPRLHDDRNPARLYPDRVSAGLKKLYAAHPEKHVHGTNHGMAILTPDDIRQIRQLCANRAVRKEVAQQFRIHRRHLYKILRREIWSHID